MTQSDHPATRGPKPRGDSTRPATTRPGGRRGNRRPYPTAPTTTRVSPPKPGAGSARSRSRGSASTPTPATVWAAGPAPIDLDAIWPIPIVSKIVGSFSPPGGRVVLLVWPAPGASPRLAAVSADAAAASPITAAPGAEPDDEVADALATIAGFDRTGHVVRLCGNPTATGSGSGPFWADRVGGGQYSPGALAPPPCSGGGVLDRAETVPADTDLIITSLRPEHGSDHTADLVALFAARLLRVGGILAVLTHCDWPAGELIDPTGAVVASAQNADLLYLQHIVALHAPVRAGRFVVEPNDPAAETQARSRHRTAVRGLPAAHRRIHSDVLVFASHTPPPRLGPVEAAFETGVLR